jgi:hypothetical protein
VLAVCVTDIEPGDAAHALVAQIEGTLSLARNSHDPGTLTIGARGVRRYLASMRATIAFWGTPRRCARTSSSAIGTPKV